jgi:hypothetical protein
MSSAKLGKIFYLTRLALAIVDYSWLPVISFPDAVSALARIRFRPRNRRHDQIIALNRPI